VIWDDISLRSTTPEIEELIETVAQLEISYQDLLSRVSSYNASPVAIAQSVNGLHSGLVTVKKTIQDLEDSIEELGSVEELGPVEAELRSQILLIQDTVGVLEDKVRALEVNLLLSFAADNMQRIAQLNSSISDLATSVELRTSSLTESLDELAAELEHHQLNSTTQFLSIRAEMANTVNAITVVEEHLELLELSLAQTLEAMNRSVNWRIEDLAISINKTVETAASSLGGTLRQNQEETDESIGYLNRSLQQMMESNRADIQELDAEARQAEKRLRNLICASIALAVVSTTLSIVVVVQRRHT